MDRARRPCDTATSAAPVSFSVRTDGLLMCSRQLRPVQIRQCKCPRVFIQSTTSSRADPSVQMPACLHTVDNFVPCRCVSANARVSSYSRQLRPVQMRQCKCPRVFIQSTTSSRADASVQMPACLHTVDNFVPCRSIHQCKCPRVFTQSTTSSRADPSISANARVSSYSRQLRPVQMRQCKCPRVFTHSTTSSRADPSVQMTACLHTVDNFVPCRSISANARVSSWSSAVALACITTVRLFAVALVHTTQSPSCKLTMLVY